MCADGEVQGEREGYQGTSVTVGVGGCIEGMMGCMERRGERVGGVV